MRDEGPGVLQLSVGDRCETRDSGGVSWGGLATSRCWSGSSRTGGGLFSLFSEPRRGLTAIWLEEAAASVPQYSQPSTLLGPQLPGLTSYWSDKLSSSVSLQLKEWEFRLHTVGPTTVIIDASQMKNLQRARSPRHNVCYRSPSTHPVHNRTVGHAKGARDQYYPANPCNQRPTKRDRARDRPLASVDAGTTCS